MTRVLIVDDDQLPVQHIIDFLESPELNCTVDLVTSEDDAYKMLELNEYAVVILDIMIGRRTIEPGLSFEADYRDSKVAGGRLCSWIGKRRRPGGAPVIVVYTVLEEEDSRAVVAPHCRYYFTKGKQTERFRKTLRELVKAH